MRFGRFGRLIGAAALFVALALPGTAAAQGGLPGGGGIPGGGIAGGGGGIPGGGGGAALTLTLPLAPTPGFPAATASIAVSSSRVDASLNGTGLPLGTV